MSLKLDKHVLLVLAVLMMLVLIPTAFAENVNETSTVGVDSPSAVDSVSAPVVESVSQSAAADNVTSSSDSDVLSSGEDYITVPSPKTVTDYKIGDSVNVVVTPTIDDWCKDDIEQYLDDVFVYIDDDINGRIVIPGVSTTSAFNFNLNTLTADQLSVGTHTLKFGVWYDSLENWGYSTDLQSMSVTVVDSQSGSGTEPEPVDNAIYVDSNSGGTGGNGSKNNPYHSISTALSKASSGDEIKFLSGTYNINSYITISKNIIFTAVGEVNFTSNSNYMFTQYAASSWSVADPYIITFNGINFVNSYGGSTSGVVYYTQNAAVSTLNFNNCNFTQNSGKFLIYSSCNLNIKGCNFIGNTMSGSGTSGGSLIMNYNSGSSVIDISYSNFINNDLQNPNIIRDYSNNPTVKFNYNFVGTNTKLTNTEICNNARITNGDYTILTYVAPGEVTVGDDADLTVKFTDNNGNDLTDKMANLTVTLAPSVLNTNPITVKVSNNVGTGAYDAIAEGTESVDIKVNDVTVTSFTFEVEPITEGTVFVDASAATSGNGTKNSPYKTIAEAITNLGSNTTISVKAGNYELNDVALNKDVSIIGKGDVVITTTSKHLTIGNNNVNLTNLKFTGATSTSIVSAGDLKITKCTFEDNAGVNVIQTTGKADIDYSAFIGNEVTGSIVNATSGDVSNNFWGTNDDPELTGVTYTNWAILSLVVPDEIYTGGEYTVLAKFTDNNNGDLGDTIPTVEATFAASLGSVNPSTVSISENSGTTTYSVDSTGDAKINVSVASVKLAEKEFPVLDDDTSRVYVDATRGVDASGRGSKAKPYKTIQYAYTNLGSLSEIAIADGVYEFSGTSSYSISKDVKLVATGDNVILKGSGSSAILGPSANNNIELIGLTFVNGGGSNGIISGSSSTYSTGSLKLINCTFANTTASYNIVKVYVPTEITGCTFINNKVTSYYSSGGWRGFLSFNGGDSTVNYNIFINNDIVNANQYMIERASGSVNIDNNYWGDNTGLDSSRYSPSGVTYNNYLIMGVVEVVGDVYVGLPTELTVEFNSNNGSALSDSLVNKHITFSADYGAASPSTASIDNNKITASYTASAEGSEKVVAYIDGVKLAEWAFNTIKLPEGTVLVDINSGVDESDAGTALKPFKTLKYALDHLGTNTAVMVKAGEYTLTDYELDKDVSIIGIGDVIITSTGDKHLDISGADVSLTNLVFKGAEEASIYSDSDLTITKCVFTENEGQHVIDTIGSVSISYTIFTNNDVDSDIVSAHDGTVNNNFWGDNNDPGIGFTYSNWVIINATIPSMVDGSLPAETNHDVNVEFTSNDGTALAESMHDFDVTLGAGIGTVTQTVTISDNIGVGIYISDVEGEDQVTVSIDSVLQTISFNVTERESGRIYVNQETGNDADAEIENKNKPFKTLSAALAANTGGYEIIVYDGTYIGYYQITKDVNITGRGNVILDVNGYYLNGYVSNRPNIVLTNLVITNQSRQTMFQYVKDLTIINCTVENCLGGSSLIESTGSVKIINSSFANIKYSSGTAVITYSDKIEIDNSVFNNVTYSSSYIFNGRDATIGTNFWGSNNPTKIVSTAYSDVISNWAMAVVSIDSDLIRAGQTANITVEFKYTEDGENYTELNNTLPKATFALSSLLLNTFEPSEVTLIDNVGKVTYNALTYGHEVINVTGGENLLGFLEFDVEEGANESVIFVDAVNGNDTTGTGAVDNPYQSLEKALADLSATKTTISLKGGEYEVSDYTINSDALIRYSKQTTVIKANNLTVNANVVFDHLIFDNGDAIKLLENSNLTIVNSTFTNNKGVVSSKGNLVIIESKFINNTAGENDAIISSDAGTVNIKYSEFVANGDGQIVSGIAGDVNDNYWGSNTQPNIASAIKPTSWVALVIKLSEESINASEVQTLSFDFKNTTDGENFTDLGVVMPALDITIGTEIGSIDPAEITVEDNTASATYTATAAGDETISFAAEGTTFDSLEFNVGTSVEGMIFVSKEGSDSNDGSRLHPVLTLSKAIALVSNDRNKIIIYNGTYVSSDVYNIYSSGFSVTGVGEVILTRTAPDYYDYNAGNLFSISSSSYTSKTYTFENIIFANVDATTAYTKNKGSVFSVYGESLQGAPYLNIINCTFVNNTARNGVIYTGTSYGYAHVNVINSQFIDNTATNDYLIYVMRGDLNITYSELIGNTYNNYVVYTSSEQYVSVDINDNYWGTNDGPTLNPSYPNQIPTEWVILDITSDNDDLAVGDNATLSFEFKLTDGENITALDVMMPTLTFDLGAAIGEVDNTITIENNVASAAYNATTQGIEIISVKHGAETLATFDFYVDESPIGKIYVDAVNGNDTNDGSRKAPYATLAKAIEENALKGGNWTIVVRKGNYELSNAEIKENITIKADDYVVINANGGNALTIEDNANVTLINVDIVNATDAIVTAENTTLAIINSTFENSNGVIVSNGTTTVLGSLFENNKGTVIKANAGSMDIAYSEFISNTGALIESAIVTTANANFWATNDKPEIENVTIDNWIIVNVTFAEAPNIFIDVDYDIEFTLSLNDGTPLADSIKILEFGIETDLGTVDSNVTILDIPVTANYNTADEGNGVINVTIAGDVFKAIEISAREDETGKIFVSVDGNDTTGNGSKAAPYATITKALTQVTATNKNIIVLEGVYETTSYYNINKNVNIIGRGNVVLTGESNYLFYMSTYNGDTLNLTGLTIRNFKSTSKLIYVSGSYSKSDKLIIDNCTIENNTGGSLVYIYYADAIITNSNIVNNNIGTNYLFEGSTSSSSYYNYGKYTINYCNIINNTNNYYAVYGLGEVNYNFWGTNDYSKLPGVYYYVTRASDKFVVIAPSIDGTVYLGDEYAVNLGFKLSGGADLDQAMPDLTVDLTTVLGETTPATVTISNNTAIVTYTATKVGDETIDVNVAGKKVTSLEFTVENPLSIAFEKFNEGENVTITINAANNMSAAGLVTVDGTDYPIELINGTGSIIVRNLLPNEYLINATVGICEVSDTLTINLRELDFAFDIADDIKIGDEVVIKVIPSLNTLESDIKVYVDGTLYVATKADNYTVTIADGLSAGEHGVVAVFFGDAYHGSADNSTTFAVDKLDPTITIDDIDPIKANETATVVINAGDATGNLTIKVNNGDEFTVFINNGKATFDIADAVVGTNNITATYNGDEKYNNKQLDVKQFTVEKVSDYDILVEVVGSDVVITLPADATGVVNVTINGKSEEIPINEGKATKSIADLTPGDHDINITYDGNEIYAENGKNTTFNVAKYNSTTLVYVEAGDFNSKVNVTVTVTDGAKGNVTIYVNGKAQTPKALEGNTAVFELSLDVGDYEVYAEYEGDNNFTDSVSDVQAFNVGKATPQVNVIVYEEYNVDDYVFVTVKLPETASGLVTIEVGDIKLFDNLNDEGIVEFDIGTLPAGNYTIVATYLGDDKYSNSTNDTVGFSVSKLDTQMSVVNRVYSDGSISVSIDFDDYVTGVVALFDGDTELYSSYLDYDDYAYLYAYDLEKGNYTFKVVFTSDKYNTLEESISFVVDFGYMYVENDNYVKIGENITVLVELPSDANGTVSIKIGNYSAEFNATEELRVVLPASEIGDLDLEVFYSGDEKYINRTYTDSIEVYKPSYELTYNSTIGADDKAVITLTFADNTTVGNFTTTINNVTYKAPAIDGVATLVISNLSIGENELDLYFITEDDEYYYWALITVEKANVTPEIEIIGNNSALSVELPEDATGNVTFYVDGKEYPISLENGTATLILPEMSSGNHTIVTSYSGDDRHNPIIIVGSIEVTKLTTNVTADPVEISEGETAVVTVVVDANATGVVLVDVGGNKFYADISNGKAVVDVVGLAAGNYTAKVTYQGDDKFEANGTDVAIKVVAIPEPVAPAVNVTVPEVNVGEDASVDVALPADATGNVVVLVDGKEAGAMIVSGGNVSIPVGDLAAGDHVVEVRYSGDDKYAPVSESKDVTVDKLTTNVTADPVEITEGETAVVTVVVDANATGVVLVDVGGNKFYADISNGKAVVDVVGLAAGNYTAKVTYQGDDKFEANGTDVAIKVVAIPEPVAPAVNVTVPEVNVGEDASVDVALPADATGNVVVLVDGKEAGAMIVSGGNVSIPVGDLAAGDHVVEVRYSGDDKYAPVSESKDVTVDKLTTNVTADPVEITEGETAVVSVVVDANATGKVLVDVGGNKFYADISNGKAVVDVVGLAAGNYTAKVTYQGDDKYAEAEGSAAIKVNALPAPKVETSIAITEVNGNNITGVLKDAEGKGIANAEVTYMINGTPASVVTAADGTFVIEAQTGVPISIVYDGDNNTESSNTTITIEEPAPVPVVVTPTKFDFESVLFIKGYAVDTKAGEKGIEFITHLLDANGKPLSNKTVQLAVNSKVYNQTTNETGGVHYFLNMMKAGRYTMTYIFLGDSEYGSCLASACVDLDKKPITIKASAKSYKVSTKTKKYTVTLSTVAGVDGKVYLSPKKVTLKVNGKTYTGKTNDKGQVTFNIKNLSKAGVYTAKISYAGDSTYNSASKSVKLTVK